MTIQNALAFIRRGQTENKLRKQLVRAPGKEDRDRILEAVSLKFTRADFEEAYSLTLFKCQDEGDAEALMAFRMWWNLLERSPDAAPGCISRGC